MAETKTKTQLPKWYEDAAQDLIALGKKRSQLGYVPWMGPDVAALDPASLAGMQGFDAMSAAFGMPANAAAGAQQYLPQAQEFAGGIKGYSGFPAFEQAQQALKAKYPGLYEYLMSFSVNPQTGKMGTSTGGITIPGIIGGTGGATTGGKGPTSGGPLADFPTGGSGLASLVGKLGFGGAQ